MDEFGKIIAECERKIEQFLDFEMQICMDNITAESMVQVMFYANLRKAVHAGYETLHIGGKDDDTE